MSDKHASVLSRVLSTAVLAAGLIAAPAHALIIFWDIDLNGANEQPPNGSPATGDAQITGFQLAATVVVLKTPALSVPAERVVGVPAPTPTR